MTSPEGAPPQNAPGSSQEPAGPPAGESPQQAPDGQQRQDEGRTDAERLQAALDSERKQRAALEREMAKLRQQGMSEQEKAVAAARDEGRAEAIKAAGLKLAAAEFKAAAAGKLTDPAAAAEVLDLSRYVDAEGEVDSAGIAALVGKLVAQLQPGAGQPGRVLPGPRPVTADGDFLRAAMQRR